MAVNGTQTAVDDSPAVKLVEDSSASIQAPAVFVRIEAGDDPVYLGGAGVTAATGFQLLAADPPLGPIPISVNNPLYGICASGETATVHVLEVGD